MCKSNVIAVNYMYTIRPSTEGKGSVICSNLIRDITMIFTAIECRHTDITVLSSVHNNKNIQTDSSPQTQYVIICK